MRLTTELNDGRSLPLVGLGVMGLSNEELPTVIRSAATMGYRLFDTAAIYGNERGVGRGVEECGLPRADVIVTSKLWNDRQGYDEALRAFDQSMVALSLDYLDLYLIHWPVPGRDRYLDSWRALVRLREEGRIRSIGVSNFLPPQLERIIGETGVTPAVNQVELHPSWQQAALRQVHAGHGIVTQAWSPLGRGAATRDPRLSAIAARLDCTPGQLILGYLASQGIVVIPKAASDAHLRENILSTGVRLDEEALAAMRALDRPDGAFGPDPMTFQSIPADANVLSPPVETL